MFQESSLDFKLVKRICLLQQALDQAMDSLDRLRQQVEDHQILESQLAQTEQYSNVQQKIISTLRQQLAEKSSWQTQVLQQLLFNVESMIEQQELVLERLRLSIQQGQIEVQDYLLRLTHHYSVSHQLPDSDLELTSEVMVVRALTVSLSSQLQTAQQQIGELKTILNKNHVGFAHMRAYLEEADQAKDCTAPDSSLSIPSSQSVTLTAHLKAQALRLEELEQQLSQQFRQQTHLKYRCQSLAAERDHYCQQLETYRRQNQDLQEQILQYTQQRDEYEAEIYYWKQQAMSSSPRST